MTPRQVFLELAPLIETISEGRAFFELRILASHVMGISVEKLVSLMEDEVGPELKLALEPLVERRASGESIAYLVGRREFFEHSFACGPGVLVPRPETEIMVEWILEDSRPRLNVHDLCTGTGCIPISIAAQRPTWQISASDISTEALEYARKNNVLVSGAVELFQSDLFENEYFLGTKFDIITANPPYVPRDEVADKLRSGWTEPSLALDGGVQGIEFIEKLAKAAQNYLCQGGQLYMEFGDGQAEVLRRVLEDLQYSDIEIRTDLQGLPRIVRALFSTVDI